VWAALVKYKVHFNSCLCFRVENLETLLSKSRKSVNAQHFGVRISIKKLLFNIVLLLNKIQYNLKDMLEVVCSEKYVLPKQWLSNRASYQIRYKNGGTQKWYQMLPCLAPSIKG